MSLGLHSDLEGILAGRENLLSREDCGESIKLNVELAIVVVDEKIAVGSRACS